MPNHFSSGQRRNQLRRVPDGAVFAVHDSLAQGNSGRASPTSAPLITSNYFFPGAALYFLRNIKNHDEFRPAKNNFAYPGTAAAPLRFGRDSNQGSLKPREWNG
jgi:hypothetical protein